MPTRPPRKGFAPTATVHHGWRDKVGSTFRPGKSVFVLVAHQQWGPLPPGKVPARLYRCHQNPGDRLGDYRLTTEYAWCLNYEMLEILGERVMSVVPGEVLTFMQANPKRAILETNWALADAFETVLGDVEIVRITNAVRDADRLAGDADAAIHCGTLSLALNPAGNLKKEWARADGIWRSHNWATAFKPWSAGLTLTDMAPAEWAFALPALADPQPVCAEYGAARLFDEVAFGGGPAFGAGTETILLGANEVRTYGVDFIDDAGVERHALLRGSAFSEPLFGHEMYTHEQLRAIATNVETRRLLDAEHDGEYLNGKRELLPSDKPVIFSRKQIVRRHISASPGLIEMLELIFPGNCFSYECKVVGEECALQPLRRVGERYAAHWAQRVAQEFGGASLAAAQRAMADLVITHSNGKEADASLDPFEVSVAPWPAGALLSLRARAALLCARRPCAHRALACAPHRAHEKHARARVLGSVARAAAVLRHDAALAGAAARAHPHLARRRGCRVQLQPHHVARTQGQGGLSNPLDRRPHLVGADRLRRHHQPASDPTRDQVAGEFHLVRHRGAAPDGAPLAGPLQRVKAHQRCVGGQAPGWRPSRSACAAGQAEVEVQSVGCEVGAVVHARAHVARAACGFPGAERVGSLVEARARR